jgi:DNA repair exonuclease SbcCD ATPase subunit
MKNFLSCGAVTQAVELDKNGLTLVLGENLDLGGNGARNGVGKSSILQAISYGLFGKPLTNIKVDNLVNNINKKNMVVCVEFEINGHTYKIERGRKPAYFKYIVDDAHVNEVDTDEAQGENKDTQKDIDKILGMSHNLFRHIVALNTYTEPFLALGGSKQREIIEELLGITLLSQKAETLRELIKTTKTSIELEELKLRTIKQSNEKISSTIKEFENKVVSWDRKHKQELNDLNNAIDSLGKLDIDQEITFHKDLEMYKELNNAVTQLKKDLITKQRHHSQLQNQLNNLIQQYSKASDKECPMCSQSIKDHSHITIMRDLESKISQLDIQVTTEHNEVLELTRQLDLVLPTYESMSEPKTFYRTLTEALNHKNTIDQLTKELDKEITNENPFRDQANSLTNTLQEIEYDTINDLTKNKEHQELLIKLLTNKDSFIRKRIIDQNLAYLNTRLSDYLAKLGLPHTIKFTNDLSTEISMLGQDLDFDSLSRGERTRLILGLCWAFRDIFENTNHPVNMMFVDELLDAGLDTMGIENSIEILKKMSRDKQKNIFLISHREELSNRVSNILTVVKEDHFSRFDWDPFDK